MTKACYVGVDGKARKVKKLYVGVDGKARKVKKAYVGVGGVARPFFSEEQKLEYYGTVTALSSAVRRPAATTNGTYALVGPSSTMDFMSSLNVVNVYSEYLVRTNAATLPVAGYYYSAAHVGDYALFATGVTNFNQRPTGVTAYDKSLVTRSPAGLSTGRYSISTTNVGDYALFAGGLLDLNSGYTSVVDAYNTSLVRSTPTALSNAGSKGAATHVGDYALVAGVNGSLAIDAYRASLVKSNPATLPKACDSTATTVGNYALFILSGGTYSNAICAYSATLVRSTPAELSVSRANTAATHVGNFAIFAGGYTGTTSSGWHTKYTTSTVVDTYNGSLVRATGNPLSAARFDPGATHVGNYAVFAGGSTDDAGSNLAVVDVYSV